MVNCAREMQNKCVFHRVYILQKEHLGTWLNKNALKNSGVSLHRIRKLRPLLRIDLMISNAMVVQNRFTFHLVYIPQFEYLGKYG